jgi:DNA-directed RNA polymerase subunit RPC12/RpoP
MDSDQEDNYTYLSEEEELKSNNVQEDNGNDYEENLQDPVQTDQTKHNIKCALCKKSFILDKKQKCIRCVHCGYRILLKLRTKNSIYYNTD